LRLSFWILFWIYYPETTWVGTSDFSRTMLRSRQAERNFLRRSAIDKLEWEKQEPRI